MTTCLVSGCTELVWSRGVCHADYYRWYRARKRGEESDVPILPAMSTVERAQRAGRAAAKHTPEELSERSRAGWRTRALDRQTRAD